MSNFKSHSIIIWQSVNSDTGESTDIVDAHQLSKNKTKKKFTPHKYLQSDVDAARDVTKNLSEKVLASILGWKCVKKQNQQGYDIILPTPAKDGSMRRMEWKWGRIGNSAVIKSKQLNECHEDCLFGILLFRTTDNLAPSHFIAKQNIKLDSKTYLRRNILIEDIYIFSRETMVYRYNTSQLVEWIINWTWIKHKPMARSSANTLFLENAEWCEKYEKTILYWKHKIQMHSLWYEL